MVSKPLEANPTPPTGTLGLLAWGLRANCSFCNSLVVRSTVYPCSLKFPLLLPLDPGLGHSPWDFWAIWSPVCLSKSLET